MIYILLSLAVVALQKDDFQINVQIKKMPKKTLNETKEVKQVEYKQKQLAEEQIHEILTYAPIVVTDGARVFKDKAFSTQSIADDEESKSEDEQPQITKTNSKISISEDEPDDEISEPAESSSEEQIELQASEPETDDAVVNALLLLDSSEQMAAIEFIFKKGQGTIERYELLKQLSNEDKINVSQEELDQVCKLYRVCDDEPEINFEIEISDSEDETFFKLDYDSEEDEIQIPRWRDYNDDSEQIDYGDDDDDGLVDEVEEDRLVDENEPEVDMDVEQEEDLMTEVHITEEMESNEEQREQSNQLSNEGTNFIEVPITMASLEQSIEPQPLVNVDAQEIPQIDTQVDHFEQSAPIVLEAESSDIVQMNFEDVIASINQTVIVTEETNSTINQTVPSIIINQSTTLPEPNKIDIEQEIAKRVLEVQIKLQEQLEQQRLELEQLKQQKLDSELLRVQQDKLRQEQEQIEKERQFLKKKQSDKLKHKVVELEISQTKQEEVEEQPLLIQTDQLIPEVQQSQVKEVFEVLDKEDPRREEEMQFPDRQMTDEEKAKARFSKRYPAKGVEEQKEAKPVEIKRSVDDIFVIESLVSQAKNNIKTLDEYIEPDEEHTEEPKVESKEPENEEQTNLEPEQDVSLLQMTSHLQLKIFNCKEKYYGSHIEARGFVCGCSQYIYLLDEDSWYLSGVIDHYKQYEFLFEKLRKTVPLVYTGTSKSQICFASQHPQPIVLNDFLQSLMYSVDYKFLELPKVVTLDYFQLSYDSKGFHQFRMKMENDDLKQLPGMVIQSIQAETTADSVNLLFTGYLNFSKQKLKFELTNNFGATRLDMLVINVVLPQDEAITLALCSKVLTEEISAQLKLYLRFKSGPQRITVRVQQTDRSFEISYSIQQ